MGFLGVALGAFGAHALKESITPELLSAYNTGVQYHLIHAVVLFALSLYGSKDLFRSAWFILFGILLFSFSLYLYSITGIKWLAMITPFGGLSFLIGWILIGYHALKMKSVNTN